MEFLNTIQHQNEVISIDNFFTGLLGVENIFINKMKPNDSTSPLIQHINNKSHGLMMKGVFYFSTEADVKKMSTYFHKLSLERQVQEALIIKERE
jgi:hypothetical protein